MANFAYLVTVPGSDPAVLLTPGDAIEALAATGQLRYRGKHVATEDAISLLTGGAVLATYRENPRDGFPGAGDLPPIRYAVARRVQSFSGV